MSHYRCHVDASILQSKIIEGDRVPVMTSSHVSINAASNCLSVQQAAYGELEICPEPLEEVRELLMNPKGSISSHPITDIVL